MARRKKTLEQWIAEAMADDQKEGPLTMLGLVHMTGLQQREIHNTKFGGGKTWTAEDLGEMFRGKAETYCQDLPGVQTFQLLAFYGSSKVESAALPFIVNVSGDMGGLGTEPPTDTGKIQQGMRWQEMLLQQVYRRQQVMDDHHTRMIEMFSRNQERMMTEVSDSHTIVREMLMEKSLDDHTRKMEALKFERATAERKKLISYAPAVANTVFGKEIFPQATADTALVEAIADSLSAEQINVLAGVLKPELMGPLAARFETHMVKKRKEEEELARLSQMKSPDPEADAAGDVIALGNGNAKH